MDALVMCITWFSNERGILGELGQSALLDIAVFVSARMPEVEDAKSRNRYFHEKHANILTK